MRATYQVIDVQLEPRLNRYTHALVAVVLLQRVLDENDQDAIGWKVTLPDTIRIESENRDAISQLERDGSRITLIF